MPSSVRGDLSSLRAKGLGGFGLHGFLTLFLAEAQLPRDPTDPLARLKAVMNNAEEGIVS